MHSIAMVHSKQSYVHSHLVSGAFAGSLSCISREPLCVVILIKGGGYGLVPYGRERRGPPSGSLPEQRGL